MDINFPSPAEELDLSMLRSKINKLYQEAFKNMEHELKKNAIDVGAARCLQIVHDTIAETHILAAAHEAKYNPNKEPF